MVMMNYMPGESQELGIKLDDMYGKDFTITGARYSYKGHFGKLLQTGEALVDGKTVYAPLTSTIVGFDQVVTFIVTIQSDTAGQEVSTVRQDLIVNSLANAVGK